MEEKGTADSDFEVFCTCAEDYDYSSVQYNDVIDGVFTDLENNIPYAVTKFRDNVKKYDIETDKIEEVTIITLDDTFRVAAPFALIEHLEIIADKLTDNSRLFIIRKESVINCFIKPWKKQQPL